MSKKSVEKTALLRNSNGSIYHLNLQPDELADTIFLVGDPDRVTKVSQHFDSIELKKQKREFVTHTGTFKGKKISVVSTGIGTDNIDIVINECDALHNVDFERNCVKDSIKQLSFFRLGTCGAINSNINVGELVVSQFAVGIDGLMSFYQYQHSDREIKLLQDIQSHFKNFPAFNNAYVAETTYEYFNTLKQFCRPGITLTCPGFYGPQYRTLRAPLIAENILDTANQFTNELGAILNVEMETAGIYALAKLLGHQACSISVVLDNPITSSVCENIPQVIDDMIAKVLSSIFHTAA